MTFSLMGRCERTGMIGFAGATSELAAGGRFPHAKAQIGAVITHGLFYHRRKVTPNVRRNQWVNQSSYAYGRLPRCGTDVRSYRV